MWTLAFDWKKNIKKTGYLRKFFMISDIASSGKKNKAFKKDSNDFKMGVLNEFKQMKKKRRIWCPSSKAKTCFSKYECEPFLYENYLEGKILKLVDTIDEAYLYMS